MFERARVLPNLTGLFVLPNPPLKLVIDDSVAVTPFHLLLGKHRHRKQEDGDGQSSRGPTERTLLPKGSVGVKEVGVCPRLLDIQPGFLCVVFSFNCVPFFPLSFSRPPPTCCPPPPSCAPCS